LLGCAKREFHREAHLVEWHVMHPMTSRPSLKTIDAKTAKLLEGGFGGDGYHRYDMNGRRIDESGVIHIRSRSLWMALRRALEEDLPLRAPPQ